MHVGRWVLALLGALALALAAAGPAAAIHPGDEGTPPCLCAEERGGDDEAGDDEGDDGEATREAVPGRVPARVRERLVSVRRGLRDAAAAVEAGRDRRAAERLKRVAADLAKAHDVAIARADDELPGGAAAVRAVTAAQHSVVMRTTDIALDSDGRVAARALDAAEQAAEDRDEAARFLAETSGAEAFVEAIGGEVVEELAMLQEVVEDEEADEDLSGVLESVAGTAEALGLELDADEDADDGSEDAEL